MALSYSVSYAEDARRVLIQRSKPVPFAELQSVHPLLEEVRAMLAAAKRGIRPEEADVQRIMTSVECALAGIELCKRISAKENSQCHSHTTRPVGTTRPQS